MFVLFTTLLGGVGLFLLGMVLLTEGLKSLAGEALRRTLVRFTGKPLKAFASGTLVTMLVQSSSATTLMVIGFVSAGLITFPQAVGVVLGATLGTTGTSWIVSLLGLKVSVGLYALPLVGIGVFLKLLVRGRGEAFGMALAGFGLIFVGIDTLQQGMEALQKNFDLSALPGSGPWARLLMVLVGAAMTVVMQSSSAATATTLTALHTNSVNFEQAMSLVIGAAIGTTVTSALASIGASTSAKRTALAHILFNLATGLIATVLLPAYLWGIHLAQRHLHLQPGAMSLAAFHTLFVSVGVVIFLPLIGPFARWIERLLPERGPSLTRHFDASVLKVPTVALEATRRALTEIACDLFTFVRERLAQNRDFADSVRRQPIYQALEQTQDFLAQIPPLPANEPMSQSRVAQMHAIDHLLRLQSNLHPALPLRQMLACEPLKPMLQLTLDTLALATAGLHGEAAADWLSTVEQNARQLADMRREQRPKVFEQTAHGDWQPDQALSMLDAMRWLDRLGYHVWRASNYLGRQEPPGALAVDADAEPVHEPDE